MAKKIIGRSDLANFPELNLYGLSVKVDTGAFSSSIHCHQIEEIEENEQKILHFDLLDPEHEHYHHRHFKVAHYSKKEVKNSFGEIEERFVIDTKIVLFQKMYDIELSLTNRQSMKFPVLLGRKILKHFLVDVTKENLSFNQSLIQQTL